MSKPLTMEIIYNYISAYCINNRIDSDVKQLINEMNDVKTSINKSNNTITVNYDSNIIHKTYELKGPLTYTQIMNELAIETGAPKKDIILYIDNSKVVQNGSTTQIKFTDTTDELYNDIQLRMKFRPVYGDHIHTIYSIVVYVDGEYKFLSPFSDVEPFSTHGDYDNGSQYSLAKGIVSSVHAHGDGRVHVHPMTANAVDRDDSSGLSCTLKLFWNMIGCNYRNIAVEGETLPSLGFTKNVTLIPLGDVTADTNYTFVKHNDESLRLDPTEAYQWVIYAWDSFDDYKTDNNNPTYIYYNDLENIWLHNDNSVFIIGYVPTSYTQTIPPEIKDKVELNINGHIAYLENR